MSDTRTTCCGSTYNQTVMEFWNVPGRVQGHYPMFLPDEQRYTKKLVVQAHLAMLHGRVGSTMAKVREY